MSFAKYVIVPILKKHGALKKDGTLSNKKIIVPGLTYIPRESKKKSEPKIVNTIAPKSKPVKYASIGRKQMRMGRSGTVVTSGGLLTNNKTTIKNKKLLGA
tara:strand:- start:652 stop:954 length:303 start_codon:yes stop_codon:yes gene_type:complete